MSVQKNKKKKHGKKVSKSAVNTRVWLREDYGDSYAGILRILVYPGKTDEPEEEGEAWKEKNDTGRVINALLERWLDEQCREETEPEEDPEEDECAEAFWDEFVGGLREEIAEGFAEELRQKLEEEFREKLSGELREKLTEEIREKLTKELQERFTEKPCGETAADEI